MPSLDLDGLPFATKVSYGQGYTEEQARRAASFAFGAARALWNSARETAENSGVPHVIRSTTLPDGTHVRATISGDMSIVLISLSPEPPQAGVDEEEEIEPEPEFYVESAWIERTVGGAVTDPENPDVDSIQTSGVAAVGAQLRAFFHKRFKVENEGTAFRLVIDASQFDSGTLATIRSDATTNINNKLSALFAPGYATGLLRCFIRGKLGRRVREATIRSNGISVKNFEVDNWTVVIESDSIFAGPNCFIYARKGINSFSVWYMTLPDELQPYYKPFVALPNDALKRAIAVCLLGYAGIGSVTGTADTPAQPQTVATAWNTDPPIWGGWKHGYWSNRALWSNTDGEDANNRLLMTLKEATFSIAEDAGEIQRPAFSDAFYNVPFSVSVGTLEVKAYRNATDAPRVWFPLNPGESWLIRDAPPGATESCEPGVPVYGFYDENDALVVVRAGTDEPIHSVSESSQNYPLGCGLGPQSFWAQVTAGLIYKMSISVTGSVTLAGDSSPLVTRLDGSVQFSGQTSSAPGNSGYGPGSGIEGGACAGGATWSGLGPLKRAINATSVTIDSTTKDTASSSAPALVMSFADVDAAFLLHTAATTDTLSSEVITRETLHTYAVELTNNPGTGAIGSGVAYKTFGTGGSFGGAIISQTLTESDNGGTSEQAFVRTASGFHSLTPSESNADVWSTPVISNLPAAFYAWSDFSGATRIAMFGTTVINGAPGGVPIGFQ